MQTAYDLLYLVSCSVNRQTPDTQRCTAMDVHAVFDMARRHSLTVAAAAALQQVMPLPAAFTEEHFKAVRRQLAFQYEWEKLRNSMEQQKIWYLPLKGMTLKNLYQPAELREMSDYDILFDAGKAEELRLLMEEHGYACRLFAQSNHDVYTKGPFLEFEMHRRLFQPHEFPQLDDYYRDIHTRMLPDGSHPCGYCLSPEDEYIFLICHLYKHYQTCGTGFRSLLDIYVFNRQKGAQLQTAYIERELQKLALHTFEHDIRMLAENVFTLQPLTDAQQEELCFFADSDSHGTTTHLLAKQLGNEDNFKAKRRYALKRIFPDKRSLQQNHPFVNRHKALYPLLVVYRPIKGMVKHRKHMKREITDLVHFKQKKNNGKFNR